jgi:hypothetical protein
LKAEHLNFNFRTLVRDHSKFESIGELDTVIVEGDKEDHALITGEAAEADIIINVLDASDIEFIHAILDGANAHFEETGQKTIFIHASGSVVAVDGDKDKIWNVCHH